MYLFFAKLPFVLNIKMFLYRIWRGAQTPNDHFILTSILRKLPIVHLLSLFVFRKKKFLLFTGKQLHFSQFSCRL